MCAMPLWNLSNLNKLLRSLWHANKTVTLSFEGVSVPVRTTNISCKGISFPDVVVLKQLSNLSALFNIYFVIKPAVSC